MTGLAGSRVLVTGAGQGIGFAIAQRLLDEGAQVLAMDRDPDRVARAVERLAAGAASLGGIAGDVSSRSDAAAAVARCVERFGGLDALVANAGIADAEHLLDISDASWQRMLDVNLTGAFRCTQEAARQMQAQGNGGAVVVTSSTNAFFAESRTAHYSATKGALVAFVRAAALDLGPLGIRINAIDPGIIRTRLSAPLTEHPTGGPTYLSRVPLRRFGEPGDVAAACAFLISDDAAYITGHDMVVDGGATVGVELPEFGAPLPGFEREQAIHGG